MSPAQPMSRCTTRDGMQILHVVPALECHKTCKRGSLWWTGTTGHGRRATGLQSLKEPCHNTSFEKPDVPGLPSHKAEGGVGGRVSVANTEPSLLAKVRMLRCDGA